MAPTLRCLLFFIFFLLLLRRRAAAAPVFTEFLYPNFSASSVNYLEKGGIFFYSNTSTFYGTLSSQAPQSPFVFSIVHSPTSAVVWSANAAKPAPYTAELSFNATGFSISLPDGTVLWATPKLPRPANAACLLDSGNLIVLDAANVSMWQSFAYPTDTLLSSQRLPSGSYLSTPGDDYRLMVTDSDAVLLWSIGDAQQFWRLSSDIRFFKDLNSQVAYMAANESGLYLFSSAGTVVFEVSLPPTKLRILKLESNGQFIIKGYSGTGSALDQALVAPSGLCDLPSSCKQLDVCTVQNQAATCNCPASFTASHNGGCAPSDGSTVFSPSGCTSRNKSQESYRSLGGGVGYIPNKFASPVSSGRDFASCRDFCSGNCTCLGFFYSASSQSCFLVKKQIGSLVSNTNDGVSDTGVGYIKVLETPQTPSVSSRGSSSSNLLPILLPSIAVFLLIIVLIFAGTQWHRRRRRHHSGKRRSRTSSSSKPSNMKDIYLGRNPAWPSPGDEHGFTGDDSNSDSDEISIPGLPTRFTYSDLASATDNFSVKIGSGGFGEVFKGQLPDKSFVAVKRISAALGGGVHGKKEFCTEIAVIGNIHHVNLVRLRGFCTEGRRRMLVYEYMNRGSLERPLFGAAGPVLEWQERMDIAIGAARGLAYLHFGCDQKIIHCDVKPENILLHDGGGVKISDFGLAKLISPEQSSFFTTMRGTRGYLAPEWLTNSSISDRTDVYSYGMVLLEIIRGRKNRTVESSGGGGGGSSSGGSGIGEVGYFPMAALEMHERGRYLELADRRLEGRVREEDVRLAVKVALCCLHEDPGLRPTMASVAAMLEGAMEVTQPRPEALNFLRLYGRGFVDYGGSSTTTGEQVTGTTSSSSAVSYSYMTSQEVSGPR
ncbi:G-type lectin S-receptor-like serine/threonine-protein kinase At5g35370 [Phalaenopsis equestris]|uniref:G-type lectin S-receptor-like serine/threonine-protein kinase At5g35370 n=1 Tax=Phalaenopsis equestris TaxID=78828 RepID=UPI0009E55665|nr:G-type lectin S-receptor-like serine/threonine-protein kinase At5g35370 [Phalaenopsis equestris]